MMGVSDTGGDAGIFRTEGQWSRGSLVKGFAGSIFINNRIKEPKWKM